LTKPAEASGGFDDTLARYEIMAAPAAEPVSRP
jgi:hypothetical protein